MQNEVLLPHYKLPYFDPTAVTSPKFSSSQRIQIPSKYYLPHSSLSQQLSKSSFIPSARLCTNGCVNSTIHYSAKRLSFHDSKLIATALFVIKQMLRESYHLTINTASCFEEITTQFKKLYNSDVMRPILFRVNDLALVNLGIYRI